MNCLIKSGIDCKEISHYFCPLNTDKMEFGICLQSVASVRAEPSHKAEMVTQLLFGELFRISGTEGQWHRIQLVCDGYEGWIHQLQVHPLDKDEFLQLQHAPTPVTLDLVQLITRERQQDMIPVVLGSSLPGYYDGRLDISGEGYLYDGSVSDETGLTGSGTVQGNDAILVQLRENAMLYLNAPYMWGGRTPLGIDCSGFVQMVYKLQNFQLLRDASQQATQGEIVGLLFESITGDLAFFDNEEGQICHVGMIIGPNKIIHCSGNVRIDHIDQEGIFNKELKRYTHKLRLIKRMI